MQIYYWSEVEAFSQVFYKPMERQNAADHAHMQQHLQPAVDRFKAVKQDEKRQAFRDRLNGYIRLYAFLSQIIPYADPELEMLYSYGRFLLPHLPIDRDPLTIKLTDNVALQYYRMAENDKIVTRYMADQEFQGAAFPILAQEIFETIRLKGESMTK